MDEVRTLLVEDHALVRTGLRLILENIPQVTVVGEAEDGAEGLRMVEEERPDLVLMDITLPVVNGLEATNRITESHPDVSVLIVSMHADEEYVTEALAAGAAGYLLKDGSRSELELAIRATSRGETYLSPRIAKQIVEDYVSHQPEGGALKRLTPRQRQVLRLVAEGNSSKAISQELGISVKTVESHRTNLMKRLDIHDVTGLVRFAIRVGLISAEP